MEWNLTAFVTVSGSGDLLSMSCYRFTIFHSSLVRIPHCNFKINQPVSLLNNNLYQLRNIQIPTITIHSTKHPKICTIMSVHNPYSCLPINRSLVPSTRELAQRSRIELQLRAAQRKQYRRKEIIQHCQCRHQARRESYFG